MNTSNATATIREQVAQIDRELIDHRLRFTQFADHIHNLLSSAIEDAAHGASTGTVTEGVRDRDRIFRIALAELNDDVDQDLDWVQDRAARRILVKAASLARDISGNPL